MSVRYLDLADLLVIAERLTGAKAPAIQRGSQIHILEAAVLKPSSELNGKERHPTIADKAAVLVSGLTRTGGLPRDNRSLAWVAMREFLARNGVGWIDDGPDPREAARMIVGLESGEATVGEMAAWLHVHLAESPVGINA